MRLSTRSALAVQLPADKAELIVFDELLPGFGLRVRRGGKRTWIVQYRVGRGQRRLTLGTTAAIDANEARQLARSALAKAQLGGDPQLDKKRPQVESILTFSALAERYLLAAASGRMKSGTLRDIKRYLHVDLGRLAHRPAGVVARAEVAEQLSNVAALSGPYAANRARAALSSLYSWGISEGLVDQNPVVGTRKAIDERPRERVLSREEARAIWAEAGEGDFGDIVRLLLLTGQRREEVAAMTWSELDLEEGVWRLPGTRTKNGRPHEVPLSGAAVSILKGRVRQDGRSLVFGRQGPFSGWSKAKMKLDQRLEHVLGGSMPAWRLHDLRRTVVTGMAEMGVLPHVIESIVNHVSGHRSGVAGVYNRAVYSVEKRAGLTRWADELLA